MLRHSQDTASDTGTSAGVGYTYGGSTTPASTETPFTAEEIAEAIAEIESEKSARRAPQNNVARISSILEQLNLDMAPSEVAAKIERRRRTHADLRQRRRMVFIGLAAIASCIGFTGFFLSLNQHPVPQPTQVAPAQTVVYATKAAIAEDARPAAEQAVAPAQDATPARSGQR